MTDQILISNRQSQLLSSLASAEVQNYAYEMGPSAPLLAKSKVLTRPNGGTLAAVMGGQEIVFNVTRSMLLRDMMLQTTFSTSTTEMTPTSYAGLRMFESIQIKSAQKTIFTISDVGLRNRIEDLPEHLQNYIYGMSLPLLATTDVVIGAVLTGIKTYTPLFCSFFDSVNQNLDLGFYEQLQIVCKLNTTAKAGFPLNTTVADVGLWTSTWLPDDKYYDYLRSKNQNPSRPLNMLTWNTYTERMACTHATLNTMRLNLSYPVFKTFITVNPITVQPAATAAGHKFKIDSFSLDMAGVTLLNNLPLMVNNYEQAKFGGSSLLTTSVTATTFNSNKSVCINWGLDPKDWTYNSGAVSMSQINYPLITVNTQTLGATPANYEIAVVHFYWNILTLDSTNGTVDVTVRT